MKFEFGGYKGQEIEEVPTDYLRWILLKAEGDDELQEAIQDVLELRDMEDSHFYEEDR